MIEGLIRLSHRRGDSVANSLLVGHRFEVLFNYDFFSMSLLSFAWKILGPAWKISGRRSIGVFTDLPAAGGKFLGFRWKIERFWMEIHRFRGSPGNFSKRIPFFTFDFRKSRVWKRLDQIWIEILGWKKFRDEKKT